MESKVPTIDGRAWEVSKWVWLIPDGKKFFILHAMARNIKTKKYQYFEKAYVSHVTPE